MKGLWMAGLAWLAVGLLSATSFGRVAAPPPMPLRVAASEIVFVGKVGELGAKMVPAELEKGDTRQMQVATVEVKEALLGKVAGRKVRVGYFPRLGRRPGLAINKDDEAIFFVRQHPTKKDTYVAEMYYSALGKKDNPRYGMELEQARSAANAIKNPSKALLGRLRSEREAAAALLVVRYRTPTASGKMEAVPAAESKAILQTLAEADWAAGGRVYNPLSARMAFARLGLTAKDGWAPPTAPEKFPEEAKKWLKENAGKYKLLRYARDEGKKAEEP